MPALKALIAPIRVPVLTATKLIRRRRAAQVDFGYPIDGRRL
jgi:hypothetical protein